MLKHTITTILILYCNLFFGQEDSSRLIIPGKGVGAIVIYQSTMQDIISVYGKGKIVTVKYRMCGFVKPFKQKHIEYKTKGLLLYFNKANPSDLDTLISIKIKNKCSYETIDGLKIGKSTRADIYKIYGPKPNGFSNKKFVYLSIGIGVEFANSKVDKEDDSDVLTGIEILKPIETE